MTLLSSNVHISGCQVAISKMEVAHKAVTVRPWKPRRPDGRRGFQGRTVTALWALQLALRENKFYAFQDCHH